MYVKFSRFVFILPSIPHTNISKLVQTHSLILKISHNNQQVYFRIFETKKDDFQHVPLHYKCLQGTTHN